MKKTLVALLALATAATANASYMNLDTFTVTQSVQDTSVTGGGNWSQVTGDTSNIYGGVREVYTELQSDLYGNSLVKTNIQSGFMSFSSDSGSAGTTLVRWDGSTDGGASTRNYNLNLDLTPWTNFNYTILKADAGFVLSFTLFKDADHWSKITVLRSDGVSAGSPISQDTPILAFLLPSDSDPSDGFLIENHGLLATMLTDIDAIEATATGAADFDFTIGKVTMVPEPASLALLGLGLVGLGFSRRRQVR